MDCVNPLAFRMHVHRVIVMVQGPCTSSPILQSAYLGRPDQMQSPYTYLASSVPTPRPVVLGLLIHLPRLPASLSSPQICWCFRRCSAAALPRGCHPAYAGGLHSRRCSSIQWPMVECAGSIQQPTGERACSVCTSERLQRGQHLGCTPASQGCTHGDGSSGIAAASPYDTAAHRQLAWQPG